MRIIKPLCLSAIALGAVMGSEIFVPAASAQVDQAKIWYTIYRKSVRVPKGSAGCSTSEYVFVTNPNMRANYNSAAPYGYTRSIARNGNSSTGSNMGWCYRAQGMAACEKREKDRAVYVEHGNSWNHQCLKVYWNSAVVYNK